jgi:Tfp pilus assembly protein FimT
VSSRGLDARGFSLVDILMVVAIIGLLAAMAIPISNAMVVRARASSASLEVLTWLENARNRATAERRNFEVTFDADDNTVTIQRVEFDMITRTPIMTRELPDNAKFFKFAEMDDTDDRFGAASALDLDGPAPHMFTSDGSFIDSNGDPSNATIFMAREGQIDTARAITIFGASGLMRSWKSAGKMWVK